MNSDIQDKDLGGLPLSDNAISSAISKLMAHPELISMVASALGTKSSVGSPAQASAEPETAVSADADVETDIGAQTDIQADHQAEEVQEASVSVSAAPSADSVAAILPMLSKLSAFGTDGKGRSGSRSAFKHEALLCALKPYLSAGRCQAIDYILRISQISGLIAKLR